MDGDEEKVPEWVRIDGDGVLNVRSPVVDRNRSFSFNIETNVVSEGGVYVQEVELLVIYQSTCNFGCFIFV